LKAERRLALTGTPVENEPGEWYSVLSGFAVPGSLGNVMDFFNRYQYPGRFGGFEGARNLAELRERSRCHYVRHTKSEVAPFLPPLIVQHLPIDTDPSYAAALKRAHREARDEIKRSRIERASNGGLGDEGVDWSEIESGAEMTAVGMLRLMCSSPRLVVESASPAAQALCESGLVPEIDGPKLDEFRLLATSLQASGERVVCFTFSEKMANLVAERMKEDGVRYVLYTGAVKRSDREAAVLAFTSEGDGKVLPPTVFISTDAGAEGLNLGKYCSTLVNLDVPWTSSRLEQRSNRIHRIDGTAKGYRVINMTLRGTLEEGILRMVENKADLQDAIFGESGGRKKTTGRSGRSVFEDAMDEWEEGR
jgi:SNF2 family DNA or RNA helicase